MGSSGSSSAKSDINVTPLVDVCLVLLITFMVMLPQAVPEVSVNVPPERDVPSRSSNDNLVVSTDEHGALSLNREPVTKDELEQRVRTTLASRDRKVVFTNFDPQTDYGQAVAILGVLRSAGAETLGIVKKRGVQIPERLGRPGVEIP